MTDPQIQLSMAATVYCTGEYLASLFPLFFCRRAAGDDPDGRKWCW